MPDKSNSTTLRERLRENPIAYFVYGILRRLIFEFSMTVSQLVHLTKDSTGEDGLPLPPPRLRYWVHGDKDIRSFMNGGEHVYRDVDSILSARENSTAVDLKFLDFGCGCGRVLRNFFTKSPNHRYWGSDLDHACIAWCQQHLGDRGDWRVNEAEPPLSFASDFFDVVVANSLFTHIDERMQLLWLEELSRVLKPGGIAIFSVHGEQVWRQPGFDEGIKKQILQDGFHFLVNNIGIRNFAGFPDFYQTSFHSRQYVGSVWSEYFKILDYIESGVEAHQSLVVLTKP